MKKNQRICERIIERQSKRKDSEYKRVILIACNDSKEMNYRLSPYELMFVEKWRNILK